MKKPTTTKMRVGWWMTSSNRLWQCSVTALLCLLASFSAWSATSQSQAIEQLSIQVAPIWRDMAPACQLMLLPKQQNQVTKRLQFLRDQLVASRVSSGLMAKLAGAPAAPWGNRSWQRSLDYLEEALKPENREAYREYYFKLHSQQPTETRLELVERIMHMSLALNLSLREGMWKSCYALDLNDISSQQREEAVEKRWQEQRDKVESQLKQELAAFYFFSFRQVDSGVLNDLANASQGFDSWVEFVQQAIDSYFTDMRQSLLDVPLLAPSKPVIDAPFPEDLPWKKAPAQEPLGL